MHLVLLGGESLLQRCRCLFWPVVWEHRWPITVLLGWKAVFLVSTGGRRWVCGYKGRIGVREERWGLGGGALLIL